MKSKKLISEDGEEFILAQEVETKEPLGEFGKGVEFKFKKGHPYSSGKFRCRLELLVNNGKVSAVVNVFTEENIFLYHLGFRIVAFTTDLPSNIVIRAIDLPSDKPSRQIEVELLRRWSREASLIVDFRDEENPSVTLRVAGKSLEAYYDDVKALLHTINNRVASVV